MPSSTTASVEPEWSLSRAARKFGQRSSRSLGEPTPSVIESPRAMTEPSVSRGASTSTPARKYQECVSVLNGRESLTTCGPLATIVRPAARPRAEWPGRSGPERRCSRPGGRPGRPRAARDRWSPRPRPGSAPIAGRRSTAAVLVPPTVPRASGRERHGGPPDSQRRAAEGVGQPHAHPAPAGAGQHDLAERRVAEAEPRQVPRDGRLGTGPPRGDPVAAGRDRDQRTDADDEPSRTASPSLSSASTATGSQTYRRNFSERDFLNLSPVRHTTRRPNLVPGADGNAAGGQPSILRTSPSTCGSTSSLQ